MDFTYDFFISHATADKASVAIPLHEELVRRGKRVWLDKFELTVGDSLRAGIDLGLTRSRFGIVVLSHSFFARHWPQAELDGLAARERLGTKVILPVWHQLTLDEVAAYSPMLAGRFAVDSSSGIPEVADRLVEALDADQNIDRIIARNLRDGRRGPGFLSAPESEGTQGVADEERNPAADRDVVQTGFLQLDHALGVGGIPRGRLVEIYGPASAGKTTLCCASIRAFQDESLGVAYIDGGGQLPSTDRLELLGVDPASTMVARPESLEGALDLVDALARSGEVALIVLDAIGALPTERDYESEAGYRVTETEFRERTIRQSLRVITHTLAKTRCSLIVTNTLQTKHHVVFGNPEETSDGTAPLADFASIRIDIRRMETISTDGSFTGIRSRVKVVKNSLAPPLRQAELHCSFDHGFCRADAALRLGLEIGTLETRGGVIFSGNDRIGRGYAAALEALHATPSLVRDLSEKAIERLSEGG